MLFLLNSIDFFLIWQKSVAEQKAPSFHVNFRLEMSTYPGLLADFPSTENWHFTVTLALNLFVCTLAGNEHKNRFLWNWLDISVSIFFTLHCIKIYRNEIESICVRGSGFSLIHEKTKFENQLTFWILTSFFEKLSFSVK